MSESFVDNLLSSMPFSDVSNSGYTESEIEKIGRLYNIDVKGQLKSFLREMGKSDGGLIGDSFIHLYRPSWKVREHFLFQFDFFSQLQEGGFYDYLNNPFVFSLVSETQYYFVQTTLNNRDAVYHYDSNNETVKISSWDLVGFLKELAKENNGVLQIASEGSLLCI